MEDVAVYQNTDAKKKKYEYCFEGFSAPEV